MSVQELVAKLALAGIQLRRDGDKLVLSGRTEEMDPALLADLRAQKEALVALLATAGDSPEPTFQIRPDMLTLVDLTQEEIDRVVASVEGGASNVQDIYPLAPLQDGILFHHLMAKGGDPYLVGSLISFATREGLDRYLAAFQAVVDRHDILRTSVMWEGLREPVQVVWRRAPLSVEEVEIDPALGDAAEQLHARFDPRHHRVDLRQAPMIRARIARDVATDRWLLFYLRHHFVMDHTTVEVLQSEIEAHLSGREGSLPRPLPFRNYVAQTRLGASREEHREFFSELLGDVDEPTAPFGLLDALGDGSEMTEARLLVEGPLAAQLRARARTLRVGAASIFHVAWAQVLARVSGRDNVVFGTLLLGRMAGGAGSDRVMGPFINTLPIRIRLGGVGAEASVRETHVLLAKLLRHEHASLALAQRCSAVEAPAPLFTSLLNYRHSVRKAPVAPTPEGMSPEVSVGMRRLHGEERTNYPLTMSVDDLGERFRLKAQVMSASVDPARVCEFMREAVAGLMEALETAPERAVDTIDVLPASERTRVVEEWNRTAAEYPAESSVHALFAERAARAPGAVAVEYADRALTYGELNARANRLAHHLIGLGVGPDARVAICVERGPEMLVAILAALKAGGAYVPLDPTYPAERLRYILADSGPVVLLASASLAERFGAAAMPVLDPAEDAAWAHHPDTDPVPAGLTPDHLCYVIYTSGSTGLPKGVAVPHRGVLSLLADVQRRAPLREGDGCGLWTSTSFDVSAYEIFSALLAGGRLCIPGEEVRLQAGPFLDWMEARDIRGAYLPPYFLADLRDRVAAAPERCRLQRLLVGVEPIPEPILAAIRRSVPALRIINGYGPTETTICATLHDVPREARSDRATPIGAPAANMRVYVLDAAMRPVPVGVVGEVYIGGVGVARGYLGRPELTAERFVADPLSGQPGARLYRAGDLARWLPEGVLEFAGRADEQVKVRGYRIELGEIETRLAEHPSVREVAVVAREDTPGDRRLVAYAVGDTVEAEELRSHLSTRLPEYMIPAAYVRLEAMPLTPSGKVDRRALPAPGDEAYARRGDEAPEGETERVLADIWAEVLGIERVGRWDDFFELGGHSLLAVQVMSRVQQLLGVEMELGQLFTWPVLMDLAREVEKGVRSELPPIEPAPREGGVPLSYAQQRLWFLEQLGDLGSAYYIRRRLRLRGELDRAALERALSRIVARHEALRTTFPQVNSVPEQRIASADTGFHLVDYDLGGRADARAEFDRLVVEEARAPFDLERGPLIRGRLVRLAADDHVLLVTMHHIVSDGWSTGVFLSELSTLYGAYREGREAELPALPVQYADFAVWQRRWTEGDVLRKQADYWARTLTGAPELLELPADHPRPAKMDHEGARFNVALDVELVTGLKALGRRHGTTLFMTILAGWSVVLSRLSGQNDVVVGTPMAGRGRQELEGLIGFFVNTLALRVDLAGAPTVAELLARVKERTIEAQHHQDIPFEQVVERIDPARTMSHHPLFQVMFTWQSALRGEGLSLPGLAVSETEAPSRTTAKFDLSLSLREAGDRISGSVTYATSLFEPATVERLVGYLRHVLAEMVADESGRVDDLSLVPPGERVRVVEEWNRTEAEYPSQSCIHELFERRAALSPGATAVVFEGERVTYGELNEGANRLARHLRSLGVGPNARVGLCVERSPRMVMGLLAVLKAGGVFVPLDPSYPRERLEYMLADSAPVAVLTQRSTARELAGVFAGLGNEVPVLELDAAAPAWAGEAATDLERGSLTPGHAAYVTYTSGSTGWPKGVPAVHHRVLNLIHWYGREFDITERDSVLLVLSFSFDGTYRNLFAPLFAGGELHLAREPFDPAAIVAQIAASGISTVNLTPTAFHALVEADAGGALAAMRTVILVGEAVRQRWLAELPEALPPLVNLYGPTECSGIVTFHRLSKDLSSYVERRVPVGRPIPNGRIYILDGRGMPMPIGAAGELHIGGVPVGPGYQNRPELTAERFVADPFAVAPGARMYRTGDRARWLADGTVEFLGRMDNQVKVRGYRIEPGEIETRLAEHPAVREAVVVAREDTPGDSRLVAYWVGDAVAGVEVLRAHLAAVLPEYMVPAVYARLDALPLTPNGKLDRNALPVPEGDVYAAREYEAPADETEEALAEIWAAVLGVERVGRWDNFFELGGHSLSAVQVLSRVRQLLEVKMGLSDLFTRPVLKDLAQQILDAQLAQVDPDEMARLVALMREPGDE